jgi:hypothetical protein
MSLCSEKPVERLWLWALAALIAAPAPRALLAQDTRPAPRAADSHFTAAPAPPFWANRGRWILGAQVGYAAENAIPRNLSHIQLLIAQPQLAFIVRDFQAQHSPVRRFEVVSEGIFGNAVHPGGRLTGYALVFRLDGRSYGRWAPFFDAGTGVQRTILSARVPELSGTTEFSPQGGFGVQYFFRPQRAFVIEWRYMHMSNAGITPPNHGFNGSMATIGFRWLRRPALPAGQLAPANHHHNPFHYLFGAQ